MTIKPCPLQPNSRSDDEDSDVMLIFGIQAPTPAQRQNIRINHLRYMVEDLEVDEEYRQELMSAIDRYRAQILERPDIPENDGWDDLEAIQQVVLAERMERSLRDRDHGGS